MHTIARLLTCTALAPASIALASANATGAVAGVPRHCNRLPATARPGDTVTVTTTTHGRDGHGKGLAEAVGAAKW